MANANAVFKKGLKRHEAGDLEAAARQYREAIRVKPNHIDALYMFGTLLAEQGKLEEAEDYLTRVAELNPKSHQIHNNLANVYRLQGKMNKALKHFELVVKLAPAFLDGRVNYAMTLFAHGQATHDYSLVHRAQDELAGILAAHPDHWLSFLAMGNIYKEEGDYAAAQGCYEKVLSHAPDHFDVHVALAEMLAKQGCFEEGIKKAEAALALRPGNIRALTELARQFQLSGRPERAAEILLQPVMGGQIYVPALVMYATNLMQAREGHEALREAAALLEEVNSSHPDARLFFCLGDLYDKLEDYGKAFGHYQQANALNDRSLPFDMKGHEKLIADLMGTYTASSITRMAKSSHQGNNMIFIVGMPRSGSTLVEQILISHPDIEGAGENVFLERVKDAHLGRKQSIVVGENIDQRVLDDMVAGYLDSLPDDVRQAQKVTDKTLPNYLEIGLIKQMFPGARILHCVRNPLDTCLSCYFHSFTGRGINFTHDLGLLGRYYSIYRCLMKHWQTLFPDDIMELSYEELVSDPPRVVEAMLAFCGLKMDAACLTFYNNPRYSRTSSYDQVRQPIYSKAVGRHLHYDRFLDPLKLALENHLEEI